MSTGALSLTSSAKERIPGGFRWTFAAEPGLREQLRTLAERENVCCRLFNFDITSRGGQLVWETRADDRAAPLVDEYFNPTRAPP